MIRGPLRVTGGGTARPITPSPSGRTTHTAGQRGHRTRLPASWVALAERSVSVLHFGHRIENHPQENRDPL
jgi:hypothetical protein